ncbi:MAG TPA: CehA/McbA family metallohydrolase [Chryseosolibacter sp.]
MYKLICTLSLLFALEADAQPVSYGTLRINLQDSITGKPTAARIRITKNKQVVNALPENTAAVMYGLWDHADGFGFQPDSSFYVSDHFELGLPPGGYVVTVSKGSEYHDETIKVSVAPNESKIINIRLERWIDMASKKWYSADGHIHIRRSPAEDPLLMTWIKAEDLRVGILLKMGDFWATYYDQYAWGSSGVFERDKFFLASGQEDPRTPELGHALAIGAAKPVRFANEYYYYDNVFDKLRQLGGLTGYAHQAESFHGYRGLMLDGLRGKVDMLELLQYCLDENPLHTKYYYHMLDLGYAVTAIAGSDFPWCGHDHDNGRPERNARIGNVRFYTYVDEPFTYQAWRNALGKGHTFVTSGPMLSFTVNGKLPGDTVHLSKGTTVSIEARVIWPP